MSPRLRLAGVWLALISLAPMTLTGCGGDGSGPGDGSGGGKGGGKAAAAHESPQAVADAMKAAIQKKDMGALYDCLTDESQEGMAGAMVMMGAMIKMFSGMAAMGGAEAKAEAEKQMAAITTVMEKHGVTDEALQALPEPPNPGGPPDAAAIKALANIVKDKRAFVTELLTAMEKIGQDRGANAPLEAYLNGELQDLKIEGDAATAKLVTANGEEDLEFRKTDGGWKLHIDIEKMMAGGMGPGPGGPPPGIGGPGVDPFGAPGADSDEPEADIIDSSAGEEDAAEETAAEPAETP